MKPATKAVVAAGISVALVAGIPSATSALRQGSGTDSNVIVLPLPLPTWLDPREKFPNLPKKDTAPKGTSPNVPVLPVVPPVPIGRTINPCRLTTENVHLRKSSAQPAIGPKPKTTCTRVVSRIEHFTTLRYMEAGEWKIVTPEHYDDRFRVSQLETLNIEYPCKGARPTHWKSLTRSVINDGRHRFQLSVASRISKLNCSN